MQTTPQEVSLNIAPQFRFDVIDVTKRIAEQLSVDRKKFKKAAYCSFHTTAGYLEQNVCSRLNYRVDRIKSFISDFQDLFPFNADYRHDQMDLRTELTDEQRKVEPKNADSHLTFIGSGLKNCVTYVNNPDTPVFFIDLDGVHEHGQRNRQTKVLFYNEEETVYEHKVSVPFFDNSVDSVKLDDPKLGYLDKLNTLLEKFDIEHGKVDIILDPEEKSAGLTVNEYETLLMTHDLVEVLKNPLSFSGSLGRFLSGYSPNASSVINSCTRNDLERMYNELTDKYDINKSVLEEIFSRFFAFSVDRFFHMKQSASLLVTNNQKGEPAQVVQGRYQSPILVQWEPAKNQVRNVTLKITRFK